jgi:hypothetical protein
VGWASLIRGACVACLFGAALAGASPGPHAGPDSLGTVEGHVSVREARHAVVLLVRNGWRIADARVEPDGTFLLSRVPAGRHTLLVRGDYCGPLERPITVQAGAVEWIEIDLPCPEIPCPKLDRSDPGCILRNPDERAKVGSACQVHGKSRLRLDVVPIHYGFSSFQAGGGEPMQFPNARVVASMGCVIGVERWAEVACCAECRAAFYWHNPLFLLHPIRPREVRRDMR